MHLDQAKKSTHRKGRRKINIEFITDKSRRLITFSKRKAGIMKKVPTKTVPSHITNQLGLRIGNVDGYTSSALGGFGDRPCVYIRHTEAPAPHYEARGQIFHPKLPEYTGRR